MLACTATLFAQTNTTGLSGIVSDPSGALIPGATVTITNTATNLTRSTESGASGQYVFDQIPPGPYKVVATAAGFSNQEKLVQLLIATPISLNFKMSVTATEVVNVTETTSSINTTDAALGTPFDSHQVQTLPYQANNVLSLLSLQAGVLSLDPGASNGGLNNGGSNSTPDIRTGTINGARQDQTNITLDGTDNNDQNNGYAFTGVLRSTRDSVQEFRVATGNANADSGRSSGAQVSLVTRSGTNAIHGSAYYYYRGPATASNTWFLKQSQLVKGGDNVAAKVLQDTYGATFGGPIKKDKLFFFGAYEGFKQASDVPVSQTVPSVLEPSSGLPATSDGFGGLATGTVTYVTAGGGLQTLSQSDVKGMDQTGQGVDAASVAYYNQFPRANSSSLGDGYNTGGYVFSSPNPISQITNIARIDYNPNAKHSFFVRGNLQSDNTNSTYQFLQAGAVPSSRIFGNNKGVTAGWIWNLSGTMTNNFRYGFVRQGQATRGAVTAGYISVSGISNLNPTTTSSVYMEPVHNFIDDFAWVHGRHLIQFGINDRLLFNNRYSDATLYANGSVAVSLLANAGVAGKAGNSFDPGTFGYPTVASSFRTSYNNAILADAGVITSSTQYNNYTLNGNTMEPIASGTILPTRHFKNTEQEYYVQDQWKVTPTVTITAGLRYIYLQAPYETNGQELAPTISMSDFLVDRMTAASSGGAYNTRITYTPAGKANNAPDYWVPQKKNFAPRFSVAWSPNNKYSVRAGYALTFDHFGDSIVDAFDSSGGFKLNSSFTNSYKTIDNSPRFTSYTGVPTTSSSSGALTLPYTPPDNSFNFTSNINRNQKTPYAETFNLTFEGEVGYGMSFSASYVGRLGRHLIASWDASQPNNHFDSGSGMTYFQAMGVLAKLADQGVNPDNVQDMAYWQNVFPNATYTYGGNGKTYTGTKAIYAKELAEDRGNETDIIYQYDATPGSSGWADGSLYHFFFPQYGSMFALSTLGVSNYNAAQFTLRQNLRYGVQYNLNYTFAKSMDEGSSPERSGTSANRISNTFNPAGNYGLSDFDVRHNITANYIVDSPFGRGGHILSSANRLVDTIVGGWQLTGVVHYSTGMPWTATSSVYGTNFAASSQMIATSPIKTTGHHQYISNDGPSAYESAFTGETPTSAAGKLRFVYPGEAGQRNNFLADGYFNMDNGLAKNIHVFHEHSVRFEAEVFNVLNTVRFNTLTTNFSSGSFGKYSSVLVNPRQMQFSAKYSF